MNQSHNVLQKVFALADIAIEYSKLGDFLKFDEYLNKSIDLSALIVDDQENGTQSWSLKIISQKTHF